MRRIRLTKVARIVSKLDRIADEIQSKDERIALHIDQVSDMVEKVAFNPQGWLPGRGFGPGKGRGYGMGWQPGMRWRWRRTPPGSDSDDFMVCPGCGYQMERMGSGHPKSCPRCGFMKSF